MSDAGMRQTASDEFAVNRNDDKLAPPENWRKTKYSLDVLGRSLSRIRGGLTHLALYSTARTEEDVDCVFTPEDMTSLEVICNPDNMVIRI